MLALGKRPQSADSPCSSVAASEANQAAACSPHRAMMLLRSPRQQAHKEAHAEAVQQAASSSAFMSTEDAGTWASEWQDSALPFAHPPPPPDACSLQRPV